MKKTMRILVPVLLVIAILITTGWYFLQYDRALTRDILLSIARSSERNGYHDTAAWFYNVAYEQADGGDAVAIELAQQYIDIGNYTKAEYTLSNAISDGGGVDVYVALCRTFVLQDKLIDAVRMLNNVANPDIKAQLEQMRPKTPVFTPDSGTFSHYVSVKMENCPYDVYYTLDGNYPSVNTTPYNEPISMPQGETMLQAIAVDKNGLVSTPATYQYTIGGVIEVVKFSDSAVEAKVREALNVTDGRDLMTNELWTIKEFTVPEDASDYTDLQHLIYLESLTVENGIAGQWDFLSKMTQLKSLRIVSTKLEQDDLKRIASIPAIKELTLTDNSLTGITPLQTATGLEKLMITENTIVNLEAIQNMTNLIELDLSDNSFSDVSPLSNCTKLTALNISANSVADLSPICALTALESINASGNQVSQIGDIGSLAALTKLNVANNKLTDLSTISQCVKLSELDVSGNALTNIQSLAAIDELTYLDFSQNQVADIPAFSAGSKLVTIIGSNNLISSLSPLSGLSNLNTVKMDYNTEISSLQPLANCPVLIRVDVFATKVTEVSVLTDQSITVNYNPVQN